MIIYKPNIKNLNNRDTIIYEPKIKNPKQTRYNHL